MNGLEPKHDYVLALSLQPDGKGQLEPLTSFKTNPAGAAIVNTVGPIRQIVRDASDSQHRYLVIAEGTSSQPGSPVQVQTP